MSYTTAVLFAVCGFPWFRPKGFPAAQPVASLNILV